ncbi:MAG TPA: pyridoxine 5'-phosphate synthase [Candidatus Saccharimonadales bacterium]|nr:pyridoxine 5'-phosphate synthase [Candidatus Saccharimonadales bacterium]
MTQTLLSVNVDHVATLRQARGGKEPDPVVAAVQALDAGAAGITIHLREDRRHIQDDDLTGMRALRRGELNMEMAITPEMLDIAERVKPERATFVPEKRQELTTEGGLDLRRYAREVKEACARLSGAGITVSLFLDPDPDIIAAAAGTGARIVEIHTGPYANAWDTPAFESELRRVTEAARRLESLGLAAHAGHGLNVANVGPLLQNHRFHELSIGHSIVSRAVILGMKGAVREMIEAITAA